jgi:hypothetical protein
MLGNFGMALGIALSAAVTGGATHMKLAAAAIRKSDGTEFKASRVAVRYAILPTSTGPIAAPMVLMGCSNPPIEPNRLSPRLPGREGRRAGG